MTVNRRSFLLGSAATLAVTAAGCGTSASLPMAAARRVRVAGPAAPIEIVDDPYGVPHIRAGSIPDAFFGQGYVVARDRLFQIDLTHRRELGRLAEAFGADFAKHDAVAWLFHYRGDLDAELARVPAACAGLRAGLCRRDQRADRRGARRSRAAAARISASSASRR